MRACVAPEFKPEVYLDESNRPTGFDVELTEKMAENLGAKVEFVQTTFDGLITGIQAGKPDISAGCHTARNEGSCSFVCQAHGGGPRRFADQGGGTRRSLDEFKRSSVKFCLRVGTGSETDTKAYFPKRKRTALSEGVRWGV